MHLLLRVRGRRSRLRPVAADGDAFTLIEVLVVVAIIALLLAILTPSLAHSREQGKSTYCLARLKDIGHATAAYGDSYGGFLPPATLWHTWHPTVKRYWEEENVVLPYGSFELLYEYVFKGVEVTDQSRYPVQRNRDNRYPKFAICKSGRPAANHAGHYRVYLAGWSYGSQEFDDEGRLVGAGNLYRPAKLSRLPNHLVLMGDSEETSERGDELPALGKKCGCCTGVACETSHIGLGACCGDPGLVIEANQQYSTFGVEFIPNRFSDRHMGGTNYLFTDFHGEHSTTLRSRLACDANLDGIVDVVNQCPEQLYGCDG
ncbi:MAG: prepilin-type N-terminal cleavage/methylation domain-containing protein [bacterium]|nr:prepilin-type N-terminal cleavage/methylation domain-containing protein [bacterium]